MSDKAGAGGAAYMHNNKDERYVKPCIPTAVVITSYRDLLACNGTSSSHTHYPSSSSIMAEKFRQPWLWPTSEEYSSRRGYLVNDCQYRRAKSERKGR